MNAEKGNKNKTSTFHQRPSAQRTNVTINSTNYRSPLNDSNENLTADSDSIVLSSDDEDDSRTATESYETPKTDNESSVSISNTESQDKQLTTVLSSDEESQLYRIPVRKAAKIKISASR